MRKRLNGIPALVLIACMSLCLTSCNIFPDSGKDAGERNTLPASSADASGNAFKLTGIDDEDLGDEGVTDYGMDGKGVVGGQGWAFLEEEDKEISLIMVGDILLHDGVEESCLQDDGTYDYSGLFTYTKDLVSEADIALVNQEVILGGEELGISGYPNFNAPYSVGDALIDAGFDVILHATNHALDRGSQGLSNCISFWKENYPEIAVLGINENKEEYDEIYVYEQDGIKVAILNYTYGLNGYSLPSDYPYGVTLLEEDKVIDDLVWAEENADFTVVCPHWGTEYVLEATSYQKAWCETFLEYGADLVIGTHPHVIEPVEWWSDDEGHEMLVYYSLGNYVNWTGASGSGVGARMVGGMACVTIGYSDDNKVSITSYSVIPLISHLISGTNGVTVYPLSLYTEELAKENEAKYIDSGFTYDYIYELIGKVWGDNITVNY